MFDLTKNDVELLTLIYRFGGYCRVDFLSQLYSKLTYDSQIKKLNKLVKKDLLCVRKYITFSKMEANTYQITYKGLRIFNDVNSFSRKNHTIEQAQRYLMKSEFLFNVENNNGLIIDRNNSRIEFLTKLGFAKSALPTKQNKTESFIHIEEYLIDCSKIIEPIKVYEKSIIKSNKLLLVYADRYNVSVDKQINSFVNKYRLMIESGGDTNIDFIILCDDIERAELYYEAYDSFDFSFKNDLFMNKLINEYRIATKDYITDVEIKKEAYNYIFPKTNIVDDIKEKVLFLRFNFFQMYIANESDSAMIKKMLLLLLKLLLLNNLKLFDSDLFIYNVQKSMFKK